MEFEHRLYELRRSKGISQEELANVVGVSRQAVQKWESGVSRPDMDNLLSLSSYFHVSLDYLIKGTDPLPSPEATVIHHYHSEVQHLWGFEYRSKRTLLGLPLVHINVGQGNRWARGIVAIGNLATGLVSLGGISVGLVALGGLSLGLLSLGAVVFGLLCWGGVALGLLSVGGVAIGQYAFGGVALGSKLAAGGVAASASVAMGEIASGSLTLPPSAPPEAIQTALEQGAAGLPGWLRQLLFLLMTYFS